VGGAILMAIGIFLPAFIFPILGHELLQTIVDNSIVEPFLDGVASAVIGLLLDTAFKFLKGVVLSSLDAVVFFLAFTALFHFTNKFTQPIMVLVAAITGQVLYINK
jgi:chromate transport protein ChrA